MHSRLNSKPKKLSIRDMVLFSYLGTIMYVSKFLMECIPNVHLLGMFTMTYTIVYRKRALIPIYIYVMLNGLFAGFALWWIPYLYLWLILWGVTMLLPQKISDKKKMILYPIVCALHGLAFGTLYAPAQALLYGLNFKGMIAWILAGLPWDGIHACGNLAAGCLILPLSKLLIKLEHTHIKKNGG